MIHQTLAPRTRDAAHAPSYARMQTSNTSKDNNNNNNNNKYSNFYYAGNTPPWHETKKLHRSCNDLALTHWREPEHDYERGTYDGSVTSAWQRRSKNNVSSKSNNNNKIADNRHNLNHHRSACDIANCGKVLWIRRESWNQRQPSHQQQQQHATQQNDLVPSHVPQLTTTNAYYTYTQAWQPHSQSQQQQRQLPPHSYSLRTSSQCLPYTPPPEQRQAYLANQHAIGGAIPLVMQDEASISRSGSRQRS